MKVRRVDLEGMTPSVLQAVLAILNAPPDTLVTDRRTLEHAVAAQRRLARRRLKELQATACVVKRGNWGLAEVTSVSGELRDWWARGPGKRWPLEDAERYAKLFGGTVRRSP
jgi:hypothetical protein